MQDPAGFTIIDVMGWGALGHAFGYFLLGASSLAASGECMHDVSALSAARLCESKAACEFFLMG
jgi:hypothetical protein